MNCPIWLPMVAIMSSMSRSGCRMSWLKNSMTPRTSPPSRMGKPNAACNISRAAMGARGKLASWTTSGMYAGSRLDQTRPGRPIPGLNVLSRMAASNSRTSMDSLCQTST